MQLLQAMRGAEQVLQRQTSLSMEGLTSIFKAADCLVSAEMLHHLQLPKAQVLGSLQVGQLPPPFSSSSMIFSKCLVIF